MRLPCGLAVLLLTAPAIAQAVRLEDRLAAPLLYLSMSPVDAAAPRPTVDLKALLADPELLSLLGLATEAQAGGGTLPLLRSILASASGEIELAMTGVAARDGGPDLPLLAFRTSVAEAGIAALRSVLEDRASGRRRVADVDVFRLASSGSPIEVALLGGDLLASNLPATIDGLLAPRTGTTVVLASDGEYRRLRAEVEATPGSLTLYADWRRLAARLPGLLEGRDFGVFGWSGLSSTQRVLLALRPRPAGLVTSLLLQQDEQAAAADGWLSLVDRLRGKDLARELPDAGVAAMTVGLDARRLLDAGLGPRMASVRTNLSGGCEQLGIDLAEQVLRPLGGAASIQVLVVGGARRTHLAYSFEAKSAAAARSLFALCKSELVRGGRGRVVKIEGGEELVVSGLFDGPQREGDVVHMTVVQDALVFAMEDGVLAQVLVESTQRRDRSRISVLLRKLGAPRQGAAGVFCFDLGQMLGRDDVANPLLGRHAGYVQAERGLLRFEALADQ